MRDNKKYQNLGIQLKKLRLEANKTINDVSGAIELPASHLKKIETGEMRPHIELIHLLSSYFDLSKQQTKQLLNLAGYNRQQSNSAELKESFQNILENIIGHKISDSSQIMFAVSEDVKEERVALYVDETHINVSHNGMMIEFRQSNSKDDAKVIAKVGMSLEHAYKLKDTLRKALKNLEADSKGLPEAS